MSGPSDPEHPCLAWPARMALAWAHFSRQFRPVEGHQGSDQRGRYRMGGRRSLSRDSRLNCCQMSHQLLVHGGRVRSLVMAGLSVGLLVIPACAQTETHHAEGEPPTSTIPGCPLTKTFSDGYLKFDYPTCWNAISYPEFEPFSSPIVDLSNQATHNPCKTVGSKTTCGWPVNVVAPGHVLVLWAANGMPGWTLNRAQGATTTVGGRPAREAVTRPGTCGLIRGEETITVAISEPGMPSNWLSMTACLRSPGDAQAARQVAQMLTAVAFTSP
jgi:hypothetical protein